MVFLGYQAFLYSLVREKFPPSTTIASIDVGGMSRDEAALALQKTYTTPITLHHLEEQVNINPNDVGFVLDIDTMLDQAEAIRGNQPFWDGFVEYLLQRSFEPINIRLIAGYDQEALLAQLGNVASFLDKPATAPLLLLGTGTSYQPGEPGYVTDVEASLPAAEIALYQADHARRQVDLVVETQEAVELNIDVLKTQLERVLEDDAAGLVGSVFIMDLQTGEEVNINGDVALSGLSILKIPIFIETYRVLDQPLNDYVKGLLFDTAVKSSNLGANLLLHEIAGVANTYLGADLLTQSMQELGLVNTFMAIPYDAPAVSTHPSTYITPANSVPDLITSPDSARQTTAEDIGTLLSMLYFCAQGSGGLLSVYPEEITSSECQAIIDLMEQNVEGNIIRIGVPENVTVSHKHGWGDGLTYGDAGLVMSPGGDYIIVIYIHKPDGWLESDVSFPILWKLSRMTYNYFNFTDPYLEDPQVRAEREAAAYNEQTAAQEESFTEDEEGDTVNTTVPPTLTP